MDAALTATAVEDIRRHIPAELVEVILLNLPHKSVVRFSSVSKSWNTMIHGSRFVKIYRGRDLIVFIPDQFSIDSDYFPSLLSSDTRPLVCPFECKPYLLASCDELWCVDVGGSLFLWNPSMRTNRKLPNPSLLPGTGYRYDKLSFGLGYDSVNDDYKILKIYQGGENAEKAELFSLRSNSWRSIDGAPHWTFSRSLVCLYNDVFPLHKNVVLVIQKCHLKMGVFVAGALHWMAVLKTGAPLDQCMLISFDLSTEKYWQLGLPEFDLVERCIVETTALKGMLCLGMNYWSGRFVLWTMKDYGVVESWTMKLQINFERNPCIGEPKSLFRLLYFYDDVCAYYKIPISNYLGGAPEEDEDNSKIFVYEDKQTQVVKHFFGPSISDSLVYVESLVLVNN